MLHIYIAAFLGIPCFSTPLASVVLVKLQATNSRCGFAYSSSLLIVLALPSRFRSAFFVQEGDRLRAADYVTGSVEIRQLRSVYKLSFVNVALVNRFKPAGVPDLAASDEDTNDSLAGTDVEGESSVVPLCVFLTKKKAKPRMADLEETAFLLRLDVGTKGCICFGKSFGDFDQV